MSLTNVKTLGTLSNSPEFENRLAEKPEFTNLLEAKELAANLGQSDVDFVARNYDQLKKIYDSQSASRSVIEGSSTDKLLKSDDGPAYLARADEMAEVEKSADSLFHISNKFQSGMATQSGGVKLSDLAGQGLSIEELEEAVRPELEQRAIESGERVGTFGTLVGATAEMAGQIIGNEWQMAYAGLQALGFLIQKIPTPATVVGGTVVQTAAAGLGRIEMIHNTFQTERGWAYLDYRKIEGPDGKFLDDETANYMSIAYGGLATMFELVAFEKLTDIPVLGNYGKEGIRQLIS